MKEVSLNTFYATIYEKLRGKDGNESTYYRMMGPTTIKLMEKTPFQVTKAMLKEEVEKTLGQIVDYKNFMVTETKYGWVYERYVKWLDDDGIKYELVEDGQHTDHEVYTVEIKYYVEDYDLFSNLD